MRQRLQVLLVEDNASVRELLQEGLTPLADVHACASGSEALSGAESTPPDLILADSRMPGLSGAELLAQLRLSYPKVALIMMAPRSDIRGPLAGSGPLVEEFLEKPFFLNEAVAKVGRVLERIALSRATRDAADAASIRGTLAQMTVVDLLQTIDLGRKSCRLVLRQAGLEAEIHFRNGQLVHARLGEDAGEAAVHAIVGWSEGSFLIDFERVECPVTITRSTQAVLLEGLRRLDEMRREPVVVEKMPPAKVPGDESASSSRR